MGFLPLREGVFVSDTDGSGDAHLHTALFRIFLTGGDGSGDNSKGGARRRRITTRNHAMDDDEAGAAGQDGRGGARVGAGGGVGVGASTVFPRLQLNDSANRHRRHHGGDAPPEPIDAAATECDGAASAHKLRVRTRLRLRRSVGVR